MLSLSLGSRSYHRLLACLLATTVFLCCFGPWSAPAQVWDEYGDDIHYNGGNSGNVVIGGDPSTSQPALGSEGGGLHLGINEKGGSDWGGWSQQIRYHHTVYDTGLGDKINRTWIMQSQDLSPDDHSLSSSSYVSELRVMSSNNWAGRLAFSIIQGKQDESQVYVKDKMGIGTRTPNHALAVNGKIRAKEVLVEATNWPDFVFEKGYDLPTIEEVARHVETAGHLPGVPSKTTVAEEGVALGEMDATLLQKIEELTLYAIQRKEQVEALKTENAAQTQRIERLKETVDRQQAQLETLKKQVRELVEQAEDNDR